MGNVRRKLVVTSAVFALGVTVLAPNVSATSVEPDSRAAFFDRYLSLAEYASKGGRDPDDWIPSTRIARKSWDSAVADESVRVDRSGRVLVIEPLHSEFETDHTESVPDAGSPQSATPVADIPLSEVFELHSLPGANRTIYLDFTGHSLVGTAWQGSYTDAQMLMPPYSADGDSANFSNTELQNIIDTWSAVAEDYAPFAVNVTTEEPAQSAIDRSGSSDQIYGARAVITDSANTIAAGCGCGGIAYVGVFNGPGYNTYYGPSLSFSQSWMGGKTLSDIVSHEVGHNVGLSHDGTASAGYYVGRDGWAPIMGVGYYQPLAQFSDGTYTGGNQPENDFDVATATGLPIRADDHGDSRATATSLTLGIEDEGIIATRTDVDYFAFTATRPSHDITVTLPAFSANLDVQLKLFDASGVLASTTNPDLVRLNDYVATGLDASVTATTTPGEIYYLEIDGVGYGSGAETGYSDYGSLGDYRVIVPLLTPTPGTSSISGTGVFGTSLTGSTGSWAAETSLSSEWYRDGSATGDTDSTYDIVASDVGKSITYRTTGTKTDYYPAVATSSGVLVTAATLPSTGTPEISGTGAVGTTLTGSTGTWPEGVTFTTQWLRDGSSAGDTDSSYAIVGGDLGDEIVFRVVASKPGYTPVTANSVGFTVVAGTISPTATPTISGTAKVNKTLTARTIGWMASLTYNYRWLRNDVPIVGATSSTYKLKSADKRKRISVEVTATRLGYAPVTLTSAQTGAVKS